VVLLGVYFEDDGVASHVGGGAGDFGCGHAAGTAPVCPEIDQNRDGCGLCDLVEEFGVDLDGLVDGRERVFALAATAGVSQMFCSDAVFAATVFAGADDGHGKAPVFPTTLAVLGGGFASGYQARRR
jgi:hypothetical protein